MPKIRPNLCFDTEGLEAAEFYCSIFPNSGVEYVTHYPDDAGPERAGTVLTVDFVLDGKPYTALNGGPEFTFDEAVSRRSFVSPTPHGSGGRWRRCTR